MYEYAPKPDKRIPMTASLFCFLLGVLLFMPLPSSDTVETLMRACGLWFIFAAVMICGRYVLISYVYAVECVGEVYEFTVTEIRRRRRRTVCRICCSDIVGIKLKEPRSAVKIPRGVRKYDYRPGMVNKTYAVLMIEDGDGKAAVRISPDDRLLSILEKLKKIDNG